MKQTVPGRWIERVLVTAAILLYAAVVPFLEINATHVLNPEWPGHARLHEVWQILTNSTIGMLCLWKLWRHGDLRLPIAVSLLILGGFLLAWLTQDLYGGSMQLAAEHPERRVLGVNLGVLGAFGGIACLVAAWGLDRWRRVSAGQ